MRWTERRGFKREIMDYQPGEEAGLKSATVIVTGEYAYGLLAAEAGVHRLVRISPFDQAARRHTSFASLYVWPELPEDVDIVIDDKDLRIDTLPLERRRRPARQRDRLRHPHHASPDRHRRLVPERALAAPQQGLGDEGAEGAALRHQDEGEPGEAGLRSAASSRTSHSAARFAATCCTRIRWRRTTGPRNQVGDVEPRARRRHRRLHQVLPDEEVRAARSARRRPTRTMTESAAGDASLPRRSAEREAGG